MEVSGQFHVLATLLKVPTGQSGGWATELVGTKFYCMRFKSCWERTLWRGFVKWKEKLVMNGSKPLLYPEIPNNSFTVSQSEDNGLGNH